MLTSRNVAVAAFAIRNDRQTNKDQYPSDHFPIVGELMPIAVGGKYTVKVSSSCPRVSSGRFVLTRGAHLENADSIDFDLPAWVDRAAVEGGEIVAYPRRKSFRVFIR